MVKTKKVNRRQLYVPLLPRHKIRLDVIGFRTDDSPHFGDNFASCFRDVWKRLPRNVRSAILRIWKPPTGRHFIQMTHDRMEGFMATVDYSGCDLKFRPFLDMLPKKTIKATIAHELAHVFLRATTGLPDMLKYEEEEREVHRMARRWGFPQTGKATKPPPRIRRVQCIMRKFQKERSLVPDNR